MFCSHSAHILSHVTRDDANQFNKCVGAQARAEAAARGIAVAKLAQMTGINRETLDRWLKGERAMSVPTLFKIAMALGMKPQTILERAEERHAAEVAAEMTQKDVALAAYDDGDWQVRQERENE